MYRPVPHRTSYYVIPYAMTQIQTFRPITHKNRKHSIVFMMKTMLRKTLNRINDLIVYKFISNKDKRKR